jgi:hypothetical protein
MGNGVGVRGAAEKVFRELRGVGGGSCWERKAGEAMRANRELPERVTDGQACTTCVDVQREGGYGGRQRSANHTAIWEGCVFYVLL